MLDLLSGIFEQYSLYTGTGIFMGLFFVALIYLTLTEKNENARTILISGSVYVIVMIFFPITYFIYVNYVDRTTYWRIWWMVPVGIILGYAGAKLVGKHRITGLLLSLFVFVLGGKFVYSTGNFAPEENKYQLPQNMINICDYLEETDEDGNIKAAFPPEFLETVRQYDINIVMPYGREELYTGKPEAFYVAMKSENTDFRRLALYCASFQTEYIVINEKNRFSNDPRTSGFELLQNIDGYQIYQYKNLADTDAE